MDLKQIAKDTAKTLISYLTYQAVKNIVAQLSETNPPLAIWLSNFSKTGVIQDGEAYVKELLKENPELALRIMTVRQHLAEEVADFLPEMTRTGIEKSNIEYRRQHLERITLLTLPDPSFQPEQQTESPGESG
ncbi:chaperonin family protein RbcX [Coleofasciculus sp. FACHB-64]|jgi:phage tail protein X|uniref:RuBisCO chaperone RbcX n=1 Tax=Cyanophyceae TaxID=3028117 RepID=UPI001686C71E|nr:MULTISPECIES: chaperonin family protein RbcX [unclassified Coleofasciculus]MBD1841405.1 chaperonin family protein RbcX [Coleofasciculus sp. FACHB-501]MBD1877680.1 chaperonin family protein RbcX [Coleofasciculus sp. FACHB-T130]MBD1888163.1 chaperonin family protein RbcX [Coleofasciculus sp. FACHB-SPT9]MBD1894709.1 chaperonin family protein RbcX [Coleofasciculus sp. FACHB-129]MBD1899545.1 chaperonin family protein RbcX [Coleofasciculus sp. FACHB-125]